MSDLPRTILAIDPATHCGWAVISGGDILAAGTWDMSVRRDESGGMRLFRFEGHLNQMAATYPLAIVVFEAARHAAPGMQGALVVQAEIQGVLKAWCERKNIEYRGYSPMEVKKHACGKGNVKKAKVLAAAKKRWGRIKDDNEADARWLASLAAKELA